MHCSHCGVCCQQTEMLLSEQDAARLEKAGFHLNEFQRHDRQGYTKLRNQKGYCFFYDTKKRRCRAYKVRPEGCRLYPVIHSVEDGIIVDDLCPMRSTVSSNETNAKGRKVLKLLDIIDSEAKSFKRR